MNTHFAFTRFSCCVVLLLQIWVLSAPIQIAPTAKKRRADWRLFAASARFAELRRACHWRFPRGQHAAYLASSGLGNGQSQGVKVHRGKNFAGWVGIFMGKMYRVAQRGAIREPLPVPSFPDFWLGDNQPIYGRFASAPGVGEKCRSSTFIRGRFVNVWVGG